MVVQDRRAADVLTNPHTLRQLEPFLGRDCTVSQAAEETGEKPNTVLSRVKRFLDLGLLKISGERPRGGRAVKLYRSAADLFFIPYEATSAETLIDAMAERDAYWEALLRRGVVRARAQAVGAWGTRVYRDARGRLQVQAALNPESNYITLEPGDPAVLSSWRDAVYLDFEDAKALQREMFGLLKTYLQKRGAQRYIVRLGMAPLEEV